MVPSVPAGGQAQTSTSTGGDLRRPTVLVFGLRPERLIDSEGRIDAFLEPPTQQQGETLIDAVNSGIGAATSWRSCPSG